MKFFPPAIGLDISENSLKAVSLEKNGSAYVLKGFGKEYLNEGVVSEGVIKNEESFIESLKALLRNPENHFPKTQYIVASVAEQNAFLRIFELPNTLKKEEFEEALKWEIEANIPMPVEEIYYDWEIVSLNSGEAHTDVMVNAVPKTTADSYVSSFNKHGFTLLALEIESVSAGRAIFSKEDLALNESVLILDIGSRTTRFTIVSSGVTRFTSSNSVAGDKFSQLLSQNFPVDMKEAEFMKRTAGLDQNQQKGQELLQVLEPALAALRGQIQSYIDFFENHPSRDQLHEKARKISKIILTGGGASLWGLNDWLTQQLALPVFLGSPLRKMEKGKTGLTLENSLSYATAIGLAMRTFEEI